MSPPELAADAPVLQTAHPIVIGLGPAFGVKLHGAIGHAVARLLLAWVLEKPLLRKARLNRHISAFAEADVVLVILRLDQRTQLIQFGRRRLARLEPIQPR